MTKPKSRAESPNWFANSVDLTNQTKLELLQVLEVPADDPEADRITSTVGYFLGGFLGMKRYADNPVTSTDVRRQVEALKKTTAALLRLLSDHTVLGEDARTMIDLRLESETDLGAPRATDRQMNEIAKLLDACSATLLELPMEESRGTRAKAGRRGLVNSLLRVYEGSSRVPRQAREANGAFVKMSRWEKACEQFVRLAVGALVADIQPQLDRSRLDADFLRASELSKDPRQLSEMDEHVAFLNEARHDLCNLLGMPTDSFNKELERARELG